MSRTIARAITTFTALALASPACGKADEGTPAAKAAVEAPAKGARAAPKDAPEAAAGQGAAAQAGPSTPDSKIGFHPGSVFEVPVPPALGKPGPEAGSSKKVPTGFADEPPVIPHAVDEYLPITADNHGCLDCHETGQATPDDEAPRIPASHTTDLRRAPGQPGDKLVGARRVCVSCHVPVSDAPALVDSAFGK